MKTVSVIIPARNEAAFIGKCLASLSNLDYPSELYEIIVADNGSSDHTVLIAAKYNAMVVELPDKTTISAVRNGGAAAASGDILVFLDADCTVKPDWLAQAERYFDRTDVACFGSSPVIPDEATWVERTWYLARKSHELVFEKEWQESTNMFIPREIFEKAGGFDERLATCEDVDLSYRLRNFGKILSDSRIVAVHHRDPRTVKEFFLKERWRGKSNYEGVLQHGVKLMELPSLVLPIYFTSMLAASIVFLFVSLRLACIFFIFAQLPVAGLSWLKIRREFSLTAFFRLMFLYNIYFLARASSLFSFRFN